MHSESDAGKPAQLNNRTDVVAFCLIRSDVLISAGYDIDRTAHQSIKRLPSAFKVGDGDIESIFLKVAATLGQS